MNNEIASHIKEILDKLGLNANQRKFYLALIEIGKATLTDIIKKSGLKKPTAYRVKQELEQLGLIQQDFKKYNQTFSVVSPKRLMALAANRQRKMRRLELEIKELLPELNTVFQDKKIKPHVELFDDEKGYYYLAEKTLEAKEKEIYYMGNIENMYEIIGKEYDDNYYIPTRINKNIFLKLLIPKNKLGHSLKNKDTLQYRETRFLPNNYAINATMQIFDNTTVFYSSSKEKIALSITSTYLAQMQKSVFNMIWDMVK